ncbi:MAG: histidine--tRNA ligase [Proteobacteria bacterium]|jgi:histidyl-tRNA synthetase|nr:histidine--tRNA ligase [Pseudomonadota bacterium]
MTGVKSIKGMNDLLPGQTVAWQKIEGVFRELFELYSYREIRTPIVESTSLFSRSIGESSDIVSKEMYTFEDRNGDSLTLRPEGTASIARAGLQHGLFHNQQQRLWYQGPMFRYERPQKGRFRQFHQVGIEAYGWSSADIEAEVIALSHALWEKLGISQPKLEINSLGSEQGRTAYLKALKHYLEPHKNDLDKDSQKRLDRNVLRILDSKSPQTREILDDAPNIFDFLGESELAQFDELQKLLNALAIPYSVNSRMVRGLDYYNNLVFEWVHSDLGAQSTVCAGGRYDRLTEQLGGKFVAAFGFAIGIERLLDIIESSGQLAQLPTPAIYFISDGAACRQQALVAASQLREADFSVQMHCGEGSLKNQIKRADKSGAQLAIILGEQEQNAGKVSIKPLRDKNGIQSVVDIARLVQCVSERLT